MGKLLDALIKFGKQFGKLSNVSQFAVLVALTFVAFNMGECGSDARLNKFRLEFATLKQQADSASMFANIAKKDVDRLTKEVKKKDSTITKLTISIEFTNKERQKLNGTYAELEHKLQTVKDTVEIVQTQLEMIGNLKQQVAHADTIIKTQVQIIKDQQFKITKLDSATAIATQRGDSLYRVVENLRKMPSPPKQWISPRTAGMIAFVTGVVAGDYLARR